MVHIVVVLSMAPKVPTVPMVSPMTLYRSYGSDGFYASSGS